MNKLFNLLGISSNKNDFTPLSLQTKIVEFSVLKKELQSKLTVGNSNKFRSILKNLYGFSSTYSEGNNGDHLSYRRRYNQENNVYYDIKKAEQFIINRGGKKKNLEQKIKTGIFGNKIKTTKTPILDITEIEKGHLFEIENLYIQDLYYVFIAKNGWHYNVGKNDFDRNGVTASSLSFGKFEFSGNDKKGKNFNIQQEVGQMSVVKKGEIVGKILGDYAIVVGGNSGEIIIVNDNIFEYRSIDKKGKISVSKNAQKHPYGNITQMKKDLNSNFLFLISSYGTTNKLHIINRTDLSEVKTIENVDKILGMDSHNNLICAQTGGEIISIHTNLEHFPEGYVDHMEVIQVQIEEFKDKNAKKVGDVLDTTVLPSEQEDIDNLNAGSSINIKNKAKSPGEILTMLRELKSRFDKGDEKDAMAFLIELQKDLGQLEKDKTNAGIKDSQLDDAIDAFKQDIWKQMSS